MIFSSPKVKLIIKK